MYYFFQLTNSTSLFKQNIIVTNYLLIIVSNKPCEPKLYKILTKLLVTF